MKTGVIWITGLSGAGKTTLAEALAACFEKAQRAPVILDGDTVRAAIGDIECGHDKQSRLVNAYRICRLAKMISDQGHIVIVATMSLFHEIHDWNRENYSDYFEVFIDVPMKAVASRDSKGHYQRGENLPGLDIVPEFPQKPDMVIENPTFEISAEELAESILEAS